VAKYKKELYSTIRNNIHNKETPLEYTENIINGAVSSELCEAVFLEIRGDEAVQMLEILQKVTPIFSFRDTQLTVVLISGLTLIYTSMTFVATP
jgi:hypothetical protein